MVFCTCKKSTQPTSPSTKPSLFTLRRSTPPLAHITTDLDPSNTPTYTTSQLRQFKSAKSSKRHVDSVLYRNRHSARKTLLTKDGVVSFSGFVDWFSRKKLKEAHERGERYDAQQNEEEQPGESGGVPLMISRVKRIDPVKSGFMGKKSERDERMGCAAGRFVDDKWKQPPQQQQRVQSSGGGVVTPLKKGDTEGSTSTTPGCSPFGSVGSSSGPSTNNNDTTKEEEGWCDVFNTSTMSGDTSTSLTPEKEPIEDYSKDVGDEGSAWYNVFQSSSVVVAEGEEENVANTNDDDNGTGDKVDEGGEDNEAEKIRGIRNIEVVYTEPKKSMLKRVSTWKRSKKDSSYGQLQ